MKAPVFLILVCSLMFPAKGDFVITNADGSESFTLRAAPYATSPELLNFMTRAAAVIFRQADILDGTPAVEVAKKLFDELERLPREELSPEHRALFEESLRIRREFLPQMALEGADLDAIRRAEHQKLSELAKNYPRECFPLVEFGTLVDEVIEYHQLEESMNQIYEKMIAAMDEAGITDHDMQHPTRIALIKGAQEEIAALFLSKVKELPPYSEKPEESPQATPAPVPATP